jgi:hypothetical protein
MRCEDTVGLAYANALRNRQRFRFPLSRVERQEAGHAGYGVEEDDPASTRTRWDQGQGDRMAQLPSLACDEPSCGRCGLEDGPGTASSRQLADHP